MYDIRPPFLAVLDEVTQRPVANAAFERIRAALPAETPVEIINETDLPDLLRRPELAGLGARMGEFAEDPGDPAILLGLARYDGQFEQRMERLGEAGKPYRGLLEHLLGYHTISWFNSGRESEAPAPCPDHVCRCAWRLNIMHGCPHRCCYCGLGKLVTALVNIDDYLVKLDELVKKNPWQTTYMYDDIAEAFALEPEQGGAAGLVEFFARLEERYLIVHTKSANVDFLEGLDHNGHTIIVWSLTPRTQSHVLERVAGTMEERIEAARRCQQWGYTIRYKFKPIIPVRGWRDEIAETVALLFERSQPDVISLFTLAWMKYEDLIKCVDPDLIDPEFLQAARQAAPEMKDTKVSPFPHEMRRKVYEFCFQEIRKHDADVPVSLSTETLEMWQDLSPMLGLTPGNYPCGCGPTSTPRLKTLPKSVWSIADPIGV